MYMAPHFNIYMVMVARLSLPVVMVVMVRMWLITKRLVVMVSV